MDTVGSFHHSTLLSFLNLLLRSAEYRRDDMRGGLARRVVEMLRTVVAADEDTREELLARVADSVDACSDKPVWALNDMFLTSLVVRARGHRAALRDLGARVMRLDVVREHAQRHPDYDVDDVCVHLRFEISLREALDLPVSAEAMLYRTFVKVTVEQIEAARQEAAAITDEQFHVWLQAWPEWQRQLRLEAAEGMHWGALREAALDKRSSFRAFSGEPMEQPVVVGKHGPFEYAELMDRWVAQGMDFANVPLSVKQLKQRLRRIVPPDTL